MSKILTLTDDEFDIINSTITAELTRATDKAQQTEELLRSSNALGYRDMAKAYASLLALAQADVRRLQELQETLDCQQFNASIFDSEDIPF